MTKSSFCLRTNSEESTLLKWKPLDRGNELKRLNQAHGACFSSYNALVYKHEKGILPGGWDISTVFLS